MIPTPSPFPPPPRVQSLQQEGHTVLKDGIDVHQLLSGEPIMFEVDADRSTAMPASNMFKGEELYNHISHFGWEEDSESSEGEGASPFEIQARKMTNVTDDGGVKKRFLHEGTGPLVPEGALVRCKLATMSATCVKKERGVGREYDISESFWIV